MKICVNDLLLRYVNDDLQIQRMQHVVYKTN